MTATWEPVPAIVKKSRYAMLITYFGLLGLFTGDAIVSAASGAPPAVALVLWLVRVLPLLIFLPGLLQGQLRVHAWLSFAILLYFTHAVITSFIPGELFYGLLYSSLCVAVFCAAVIYIRVARKHLGQNLLS